MLFASVFGLQKKTLLYAEQFFMIGSRMCLAGVIMLMYLKITQKIKKIQIKHYSLFISLSIYNIFLTNTFEIYGLNKIESSTTCLIYSISPFIAAFINFIVFKEKINHYQIFGLIIGIFGILIGTQKNIHLSLIKISKSEISIFLGVICNVIGWIQLKKLLNLNYSPILINSVSMLLGGILITFQSYLIGEQWNPLPIKNSTQFLNLTIITCIISNLICYNLFAFLLKKFSVTFMNFTGLLTPLFALMFGHIFLNEKITIYYLLSIPVLFIGLIIFYKKENTQIS